MIRAIRFLDLRRIVSLRLRSLIAVIAVAAGSSLALSVVIVRSSVTTSLQSFGRQLAGMAPLRVVGADTSGGLEQSLLAKVSATPGVRTAAPVVEVATVIRTRSGRDRRVLALGLDCRAGALVGQPACVSPSQAAFTSGPALVSPDLASQMGGPLWVETAGGVVGLSAALELPALDNVNGGATVAFALAEAQKLFDRVGRLDAIYVLPDRSVPVAVLQRRLARVVGASNGVLSATDPPPQLEVAIGAITPLLTLLAVLASGIAVVLVYNVVNLSLEQRRRERAIAAAVGAPPVVMAAGPLIEAGLLGAVGGLIGAAAGTVLAAPTVHSMSTYASELLGVTISVHASALTYLIGLVLGVVIGTVAAIRPVRLASRLDIAAEISGRDRRVEEHAAVSPRRGLLLVALALLGLVGSWLAQRHGALDPWQPAAATLFFLLCVFATVLAVGFWAPVAIRLIMGRRRWGGVTRLAMANLVREPGRTAVMAVAVASSVGVALMTASFNRSVHDAIASGMARSAQHHSILVSNLSNEDGFNIDGRVPASALRSLSGLPGVTRTQPFYVALTGHETGQLVTVETDDYLSGGPAIDLGTRNEAAFERGEAMVGPGLARRLRLGPGSSMLIDTPKGTARLRVDGVWENGDFDGDNLTVTPGTFERLYGPQLPSSASLIASPTTDLSALAARAASEHLSPALVFSTPSQVLANASSSVSTQLAPFWALQRALLLVTFVSVLSTLLLAGLQRRREFGLLAAVGLTRGGLFQMVLIEALATGAVAAIFGVAMGALDMGSLVQVIPLLVGYHDPYRFDAATLVVYVPLAIAVAAVAALWPGWRTSRIPVVEALQYE